MQERDMQVIKKALVLFSHEWYYKSGSLSILGDAHLCFSVSSTYMTFLVCIYMIAQTKATHFQTVHMPSPFK